MTGQNQNSGEASFRKVAAVHEIARGSGKRVEVEGVEIAIFNFNGSFFAISDICPHRGAPLSEGFLEAGKVFCPWHCFDFNLRTGECTTVPSLNIETYEVKIEGDDIFILYR